MKRSAAVILFLCGVLNANTEPPLPIWDDEERARMMDDGWVAGSSLLTYDPLPEVREAGDTPLAVEEPTPEEIEEVVENENVVDEEFLAAYFAERPEGYLVDPQDLLDEVARKNLEAFLVQHAGESSIDMRLYVYGGEQVIPGDVREEEVVERLYSVGKPALVINYYLGAPQRSEIYLSPILTDAVSASEQRRALQSSVVQAFTSAKPVDQLQSFLVQMSIRAYWMERMAEGTAAETLESIPSGERAADFRKQDGGEKEIRIPSWAKIAASAAAAGFGALLMLWSLWMVFRVRARYRFPEFEVEARLGGSHAAGIGAVISFASASAPPANQRNQVPDYMRRA
ncbi:hypothetical protein [Luteolibacter sp. AS25]|uniref:hypothetical protein n=1 Tax=Luteolibacter sp. AS25 TaxID=3135776 RepID=UPI00398AD95D